nr:HNH endonuclease family protein [Glutamicibacter sp.]
MRVARPGRVAVLLLAIALTGCAVETSSAQPPAAHSTSSTAPPIVIRTEAPPITISSEAPTQSREQPTKEKAASQAQSLLDDLQVKGRAPKSGYDRGLFGSAWSDTDHNGCDTRNDILRRDLDVTSYKSGTRDCVVLTGVLDDPYTGESIAFERGQGTSNAVQIDHVIALSDAWQKGAQNLSPEQRVRFANDP